MRLLVFSTLYPNAAQPHHGIFVENRLRHLVAESGYEARVVAPVPWFPFAHPGFGRYATFAQVPHAEQRYGLKIEHPRYPAIPKVGMGAAPFLLYAAIRPVVSRLLRTGYNFDIIDAHYFYPDGVAAALLARAFDRPFVVTARGSDLNVFPQYLVPRRLIRWAAGQAAGIVTVSESLRDKLANLGLPPDQITVLRNGVDFNAFQRDEAGAARIHKEFNLQKPVLAVVGNLVPLKGVDLAIRALATLQSGSLLVIGTGPEAAKLERLARNLGVRDRTYFLGALPHTKLKAAYSAADVLVLASSREGWPNVLMESLACGTPIVATAVNGVPEIIQPDAPGRMVAERTPEAIADAVRAVIDSAPEPAAVRRYAEGFSWRPIARGQMALFERILADRGAARRAPGIQVSAAR